MTSDAGAGADPAEERLRRPAAERGSDALTFAFGDPDAQIYGLARLGVADAERRSASGLGLLFSGSEIAAVRVDGGHETDAADWGELNVAGIASEVAQPLERWRVSFDGGPEGGFELEFDALGQPAAVEREGEAARLGGMVGYEHACRVSGTARVGAHTHEISCLGQRGHAWGEPDWERISLARTIGAWLDDDLALTATAIRAADAADHEAELLEAVLLEGAPLTASRVAEPRLSTVYDAGGRHRRAGLELWVSEDDDFPRRCAGEVVCGTSLELGRLTLRCAFLRWHMDGRHGVGRYDVISRS